MDCNGLGFLLYCDLIGFVAGTVITLLFLVLAIRAYRMVDHPVATLALAACSLIWDVGNLVSELEIAMKVPATAPSLRWELCAKLTIAVLWTVPMLQIWRRCATFPWHRRAIGLMQGVAIVAAAAILTASAANAWQNQDVFLELTLKTDMGRFLSFYSLPLFGLGFAILLRQRDVMRAHWFASVVVLLGISCMSVGLWMEQHYTDQVRMAAVAHVIAKQSSLLILFGSFFLFGRIRFADVFIRQSFRVIFAALVATGITALIDATAPAANAGQAGLPEVYRLFGAAALVFAALLTFTFADRGMAALVDRRIFRVCEFPRRLASLEEGLSQSHDAKAIADVLESTSRDLLDLEGARLIAVDTLPAALRPMSHGGAEAWEIQRDASLRSQLPLPRAELLVPIESGGKTSHVLAVAPGPSRRALVTGEISFLNDAARIAGRRLDTLRWEREAVERRSREAVLIQQATEAELRALRAQINPHFLFNSLNTIADLIATDPKRAETMTVRLSQVFRHVLSNSSRAFVTLQEEIDFIRAYLNIEEARFGDRLSIGFEIDPAAAPLHVPSLILQPLVENALKHGLAPKPGPGHLRITASLQPRQVCLAVEDDGVGWDQRLTPSHAAQGRHSGVGLANLAERLSVLYRDRAKLHWEARKTGGSRVTIVLPSGAA